jgi:stress-induced morphogen
MMPPAEVEAAVKAHFPNAHVEVFDKTGVHDHYIVFVCDDSFSSLNAMARHRAVYAALNPALSDGRLHAVEIKTQVPAARP